MNGINNEYIGKSVQILGGTIDQDGQRQNTQQFIAKFRPVFPVGMGNNDEFRNMAGWSPVMQAFVPYFIFIDQKGQIRAAFMGNNAFFQQEAANTKKMIDQLLGEGKPPAAAAKPVPKKK